MAVSSLGGQLMKRLMLASGIVLVLVLVLLATSNKTGAETPSEVTITDITDSSFKISWTTVSAVNGNLTVDTISDFEDVQGPGARTVHSVKVTGLSPLTTYQFKINHTDVPEYWGDGDATWANS